MICTEMYPLHFFCGILSVETYRLTDKLSILSQLFTVIRFMVASRTASHRKRLKSHADSTKLVKPSSRIARLSQSP